MGLFESVTIKNMTMRNRFVRSATYDGCSDRNGRVTGKQIRLFTDLAEGGVGLIVTGIAHVHPSGQISPFQNTLADDVSIPGFQRLTRAVHDRGAKIAAQLFHAGRESARFLKPTGASAIAPSIVPDDPFFKKKYRAATKEEISTITRAFGDAAARAKTAGFDAVQVHGAHAYLLSQFLSPYTNRRDDEYGGSFENRLRFHREIYLNIREKVGEDYPVLIKTGGADGFAGGLEFREGKAAAKRFAEWGFDALELSQGLRGTWYEGTEFRTKINRIEKEAYFRSWSKKVKRLVDIPVMMVGGLRSIELMEEIIANGEADFISLCRPLIKDPHLIDSWQRGRRARAACISCNKCYEMLVKGEALHCVLNETHVSKK
jgi:2,4-dienoyl-CoA reductase-like NADH-dependent reductase (Old Yellow Enzyme family)